MPKPVLAELFIDHNQSDRQAIHLFVAEPTPLEEKNLGRLFTIFSFVDPQKFTDELINSLDQQLSKAFYHSTDFDVETTFERALQKVNKVIQEAVTTFGEDWIYNVSAIIGVLHNQEVFFSHVGAMEAFFVQQDSIIPIVQPSNDEIKPIKLFSNIISGQCPINCGLIFCTNNLLDYLSQEKLRRTIKEYEPKQAVQYLSGILTEHTTLSNIAGLIIKTEHIEHAETAPAQIDPIATIESDEELDHSQFGKTQDSMHHLISQEQATGDLLTPSIWPSLKNRWQALLKNRQNYTASEAKNYRHTSQPTFWKTIVQILFWLQHFLINIITSGYSLFKKLFKNKPAISNYAYGGTRRRWQRLSQPRKVLLAVFVAIVLIFIISVVWKNKSVQQQTEVANWDKTISQVENYVGEAESKQIIPDEDGARSSLAKAEELLNSIPPSTAIWQERGQGLRDKINNLNNILNKVTVLTDVALINNYSAANEQSQVNNITKIGDYIYGFDKQNKSVYRLNSKDGTAEQIITTTVTTPLFQNVVNDSAATTLILMDNNSFEQFNPVLEKTSPVTSEKLSDQTNVKDINLFNNRLYLLDAGNKQIYKEEKNGDKYNNLTDWLKDGGVDLSSAVSFDIDASIYVLLQSGEILKLDEGKKSDFSIANFTPNLAGATKIVKPSITSKFYILNPATKRIVLLSSSGSLEQQFTAEQFDQLQDMVVDETNNIIYVLANNSVYKVPLE